VKVCGEKDGCESSSMTFVSSWANPPCSASFLVLFEYVTPTLGATMMSGLRGSFGGRPGALNICVSPLPQKICPMPAMLAFAGDCVSSAVTSVSVEQPGFSHSNDTSSSVGPIWPPALDCESGRQLSMISDGDVVTGPVEVMRV